MVTRETLLYCDLSIVFSSLNTAVEEFCEHNVVLSERRTTVLPPVCVPINFQLKLSPSYELHH